MPSLVFASLTDPIVQFAVDVIDAMGLPGIFLLMVAESVFIWLLLRSRREDRKPDEGVRRTGYSTKEIIEAQARALPEPAASITEHTTRTLETAERERQS